MPDPGVTTGGTDGAPDGRALGAPPDDEAAAEADGRAPDEAAGEAATDGPALDGGVENVGRPDGDRDVDAVGADPGPPTAPRKRITPNPASTTMAIPATTAAIRAIGSGGRGGGAVRAGACRNGSRSDVARQLVIVPQFGQTTVGRAGGGGGGGEAARVVTGSAMARRRSSAARSSAAVGPGVSTVDVPVVAPVGSTSAADGTAA